MTYILHLFNFLTIMANLKKYNCGGMRTNFKLKIVGLCLQDTFPNRHDESLLALLFYRVDDSCS